MIPILLTTMIFLTVIGLAVLVGWIWLKADRKKTVRLAERHFREMAEKKGIKVVG